MKHVRPLLSPLSLVLLVVAIPGSAFAHSTAAWLTSRDGSRPWQKINSSSVSLSALGFADFDANGKTDIFRAADGKWFVSFDGVGQWQQINTSSVPLGRLRFGDFDGNGRADVFRSSGGTWFVSFDGVGQWQEINTSNVALDSLRFGDFDGNGKTDVFRTNGSKWFVSFDGVGQWQQINTSSVGIAALGFGDFDGNGRTDVFRSGGGKWWVSSNGTSVWQQINTSSVGITSLRFADFDGNGRTDVFRANGSTWFVSFDGTRPWQQLNTSSFGVSSLRFGDFDGNGKADVFRRGGEDHIGLQVYRFTTASIDDSTVDGILADTSTVLQTNDGLGDEACLVHFTRVRGVTVFNVGDGSIDSESEYNVVLAFPFFPMPMTNTVKVVNQINWCDVIKPGFLGCAPLGGRSQVVLRTSTDQEGILWAHEYGHTQGRDHRDDSDHNVMFRTLAPNRRRVNGSECRAFRN